MLLLFIKYKLNITFFEYVNYTNIFLISSLYISYVVLIVLYQIILVALNLLFYDIIIKYTKITKTNSKIIFFNK